MAFNKIVPLPKPGKTAGTAMVRIVVNETRKGSGKLRTSLIIADTFIPKSRAGKDTYVVVYEGSDEDFGKLRVEYAKAGDEGAIKLSKLPRGGYRTQSVMAYAARPTVPVKAQDCRIESQDDDGFTISLPVEYWQAHTAEVRQLQHQAATVKAANNANKTETAILYNMAGTPIPDNMPYCKPIAYCKKKGVGLYKMNGDFWGWREAGGEGERITTDDLVLRINKMRHKEGVRSTERAYLIDESR